MRSANVTNNNDCDPHAIIDTLNRRIEELRPDDGEAPATDTILQDPILFLMVHRLADLFHVTEGDEGRTVCYSVPPGVAFPGDGSVWIGECVAGPDM